MRPPLSAGCTMSLSRAPVIVIHEPTSQTKHHHPARHEHDRAVVALDAEIDDQADADDRGAGEGQPRHAGRYRRIEHRDAETAPAGDPHQRAIAEMAVQRLRLR